MILFSLLMMKLCWLAASSMTGIFWLCCLVISLMIVKIIFVSAGIFYLLASILGLNECF